MAQQEDVAVAVRPRVEIGIGVQIGSGLLLGIGVVFVASYLAAGFVFFTQKGATQNQAVTSTEGVTTCGTYTSPDGGLNLPIVASGQVDPDCVTTAIGKDVCYKAQRPICLMAEPTPPQAIVTFQDGNASVAFEWTTGVRTASNCVLLVRGDSIPNAWRCVYGNDPGCGVIRSYLCSYLVSTDHKIPAISAPQDVVFYYGVESRDPATNVTLRSEIRTFTTVAPSTTPTL